MCSFLHGERIGKSDEGEETWKEGLKERVIKKAGEKRNVDGRKVGK